MKETLVIIVYTVLSTILIRNIDYFIYFDVIIFHFILYQFDRITIKSSLITVPVLWMICYILQVT